MLMPFTSPHTVGDTLPIRPFLSGEASDPETIRELSLALESVCSSLGLKVIDDPATAPPIISDRVARLSHRWD